MKLLGKWNWYLPSWLEWVPNVRFEPAEAAAPSPADDYALQQSRTNPM